MVRLGPTEYPDPVQKRGGERREAKEFHTRRAEAPRIPISSCLSPASQSSRGRVDRGCSQSEGK